FLLFVDNPMSLYDLAEFFGPDVFIIEVNASEVQRRIRIPEIRQFPLAISAWFYADLNRIAVRLQQRKGSG
ncbi:MAG: hypothetical protein WBX02_12685, partial [Terriglobales bacterium]